MPATLVADHNPESLSQIEMTASQSELAVLVATDSEDLITKANAVEVDVVILDADFDEQGLSLYQRLQLPRQPKSKPRQSLKQPSPRSQTTKPKIAALKMSKAKSSRKTNTVAKG